MIGIIIPVFIYFLVVVDCTAIFGYDEISRLMWPTLELVKTPKIPGLIFERLESGFLGIWFTAIFTTVGNMYFSACFAAKKALGINNHRYIAILVLPALYYMVMWPENVHQLFRYDEKLGYVGLILGLISPILSLMLATFRKKGHPSASEQDARS